MKNSFFRIKSVIRKWLVIIKNIHTKENKNMRTFVITFDNKNDMDVTLDNLFEVFWILLGRSKI